MFKSILYPEDKLIRQMLEAHPAETKQAIESFRNGIALRNVSPRNAFLDGFLVAVFGIEVWCVREGDYGYSSGVQIKGTDVRVYGEW